MKSLFFAILFFSITHVAYCQNSRLWATYLGGPGLEGCYTLTNDRSGNIYVAGNTDSLFNLTYNGFQNTYGGGSCDAFLTKFDGLGTRIWSTYYGGPSTEIATSSCVDPFGNIYLGGRTSSNTNISSNGCQNIFGGGNEDAFLVKFDSSGNRLWATYYGGMGDDLAQNIATDYQGNIYLYGFTTSSSGIAFQGYQNALGGAADGFLIKFDSNGNRIWGTYIGGPNGESSLGLAVSASGNIYISGYTESLSGIAYQGYQNTLSGTGDAFLMRFNSSGNKVWGTYYGGNGQFDDWGSAVALDRFENVYLAGSTTSLTGISQNGFQNTFGGGTRDAFLIKFDSSCTRLWGTYYGGSGNNGDEAYGVATDSLNNVYLSGDTYSPNNISSGGFQNIFCPGEDCFVATFDKIGNRLCATYYGGTGVDEEEGYVSLDKVGNVYLAGSTPNNNGIASGGFQNTFGGQRDVFLVKLTSCTPLSITEASSESMITISPNPSSGIFTISSSTIISQIEIFDVLGKQIQTLEVKKNEIEVDITSQPKGIYFVKVWDEKGNAGVKKIVLQ